jgi:hypothetical protein
MSDEKRIIDARVIALDKTELFEVDDEHKEYIESIEIVYIYDKNETSPLCENSQLYHMIYTGIININLKEKAFGKLTDDQKEYVADKYMFPGLNFDIYLSCEEVDTLAEELQKLESRYYIEGKKELPRDMSYEEYMEELVEDCTTNYRL